MARRTRIGDVRQVEAADDFEQVVRDKRSTKRASKRKGTQRHRHYVNTMLRHLVADVGDDATDP